MARLYELDVQPGLFGDVCLTRHWGRIGTHGQTKEYWYPNEPIADELANKLLKRKARRGYLSVAPSPVSLGHKTSGTEVPTSQLVNNFNVIMRILDFAINARSELNNA
ncbi:WGR domain-containing protein [Asticcacaulis benevestitus]|uniref:WGR domain-containing protein n=1 Tax=Asticcacaulis benevestitus DSM 16100 = ATCC BAA-896 TaxID=1121022 RepID=V4PKN1_9CAUL|nr:WGR domain-containing protein [Asticcacaulis benevestitus]ESQ87809.1 hypothetical protein ABENE_16790 [Asticcacaulis benevestitus DSM 16100 = ATCC BAA-896]